MAAAGVVEDPAVQAARILLTLRKRKLLRWPEWVQKEPVAEVEVEVRWPLQGWPKRPRSGDRLRGDWLDALSMPKLGGGVAASVSAGSGACSSGEERDRRWRERRSRDSPAYCNALAGSGPSSTTNSADRKARPRHAAVEKAAASAVAPVAASATAKEPMKVSSPETPLDFAASAAGSGASSSGDDAAQPPSKRRADEAVGSAGGGPSSGDEGCSSPDKRARLDAADGDKAISEPKMQTPEDSKKAVKFEFDLNMLPEDEECPGFC